MKIVGVTKDEQAMVDKLIAKGRLQPSLQRRKKLRLEVFYPGNFVNVVLEGWADRRKWVGVCKFNPNDKRYNGVAGRLRALHRALTGNGYGQREQPSTT